MKKNFKFIICLVLSLFAIATSLFANNYNVVKAETIYDLSTYFQDSNLYSYLTHLTNKDYLEIDSFASISTLDISYENTSTYFTTSTVKFTSLAGLQKLNLNNLKVLKVNGHNLTSVSSESELINISALEELDISNNKITSANLKNFTKLKKVDLSNNEITDLNHIILDKTNQSASVYLSCNYIDLTNEEFDNLQTENINYQLGLQGVNLDNKFYGKDITISFFPYKNENKEEICNKVFIYKNDETSAFVSLPYEESGNTVYSATLSYAKYLVKFLLNDTTIIAPTGNVEFTLFVPKVITEFYQNEEKVDQILIAKSPVTVKFVAEGDVYIKINNETEFKKLSEVKIDKNGIYNIYFYQVLGGHTGDIQTINISYKITNPLDFVIIIIGIVIFVVAIYFALMYANRPINGKIRKKEKY